VSDGCARASQPTLVEPDWREIAEQLERWSPERWALPEMPFDFDAAGEHTR
jgi:hypothetical protein